MYWKRQCWNPSVGGVDEILKMVLQNDDEDGEDDFVEADLQANEHQ